MSEQQERDIPAMPPLESHAYVMVRANDLAALEAERDAALVAAAEMRAALKDYFSVIAPNAGSAVLYCWALGVEPHESWTPEARAFYALLAADPMTRGAEILEAAARLYSWLHTYRGVCHVNAMRNGNDVEIELIDSALEAWRALLGGAGAEGEG